MLADHNKPTLCYGCHKIDRSVLKKCSGCRSVWYCSEACSRTNWPKHKVDCRGIKGDHDRSETTSLAAPLGEAYRVESAVAYRAQLLPSLTAFLSFATLPTTIPGENLILFIEFSFVPDAPDLRGRWSPGANRFWRTKEWLEYLRGPSRELEKGRKQDLYSSTMTALDDIPKVIEANPSVWASPQSPPIIIMGNFKDLPIAGDFENYMYIYTLSHQAPCATSGVAVDWLKMWKDYVTKTPLLFIAEISIDRLFYCTLAASCHIVAEPHLSAAQQHWESLPPLRRVAIYLQLLRRYKKIPTALGVLLMAYVWLWEWGDDLSVDLGAAELKILTEEAFQPSPMDDLAKELKESAGRE